MFWKRAQAETKLWIQNNAAALGSIHEHFFFPFPVFLGSTVASEGWSISQL